MPLLQTATISNQNISSALLVGTYTANAERSALTCTVLAKEVAGNGLYTVYATRQLAGAGSAYEYQARATVLVESGITAIAFPSIVIPVSNTDVVKVYMIGLAGDTTTPDIICEFWDLGFATATDLATVDTVVDAIKVKTDNLPTDPADESLLEAAITAATSPLATAAALAVVDDFLDTEIAAIKAKTDNLPTDPADESLLEAAIAAIPTAPTAAVIADAVWDEVLSGHVTTGTTGKKLTDLSNADLSSLATAANLATVDTVVDAIKAKTDNLPTDPADESLLEAAIAAIPSAPTVAVIADAVWDEVLSGHVTTGTTGKKLSDLSSGGGGSTAEEIDTLLSSTHGAGAWGSGGVGAVSHTITVNSGGSPLDGADVWVTTDISGSNVAARGTTNAFGQVTFFLDAGTYYGWKQLNGYTFTNPTEFTVE
jgi:hypothetical protein